MKIIVYQVIEDGHLINKAGYFKGKKFIKEIDYEEFRKLKDKGVEINML